MASKLSFTDEEMAIDEALGYPKAFARLCRNPQLYSPFIKGPPFTFVPYVLQSQDALRARDLNQMFPVIDLESKPSANPNCFVDILWKRLNHLGNAGFDPAMFRVDPYGNVLYFYADPASPLAWEIDHWFPCSRGGRTLPANLRILQWQVSKRKKNRLEILVPWWDLQLGISVNQFLSIFASRNADFRNRAFALLFTEGENDQVDNSQVFDCHTFPQHFMEKKRQVGLAPAAIVLLHREAEPLKSLDLNKPPRPSTSSIARKFTAQEDAALCKAVQRFRPKENEELDVSNQYAAIARESLKQREETTKTQAEIWELEEELNELKQKNEIERQALQDLECLLIKRRRRVEKCRRLADAQSNYKTLLEKMIRDAMHQSIVYKEQARMNQAATSALMARLEAQKSICDLSEKELHRRYKQRDEIEKQIRPSWEQARKRSRIDDTLTEEWHGKNGHQFPVTRPRRSLQKELRLFLEEEQKASEAGVSLDEDPRQEEAAAEGKEPITALVTEICREDIPLKITDHADDLDEKLMKLAIQDGNCSKINEQKKIKDSFSQSPEEIVDEEYRRKIGKGNVDKWLQMLLESTQEGSILDSPPKDFKEYTMTKTEVLVQMTNSENPQQEIKVLRLQPKEELGLNHEVSNPGMMKMVSEETRGSINCVENKMVEKDAEKKIEQKAETGSEEETVRFFRGVRSSKSFEGKEKERKLVRCESARTFGSVPASPSVIWGMGMKRGVDCIGKKPMVDGDDDADDENHAPVNSFLKTSIKALKKAVKK